MKRIAAAAVMAAFMSVSLGAVATAHTAKYFDVITFSVKENGPGDADTFEGRVISDRNRCAADRVVRIYREVKHGEDALVDKGRTNGDGEYSFPADELKAGSYYAIAARKVLRSTDNHTHVCTREVSPERPVANTPT